MRFPHIPLTVALIATLAVASCSSGSDSPKESPAVSAHSGHSFSAPPPAPARAGEHFKTLSLPAAYTPEPPAGGTDDYRCFIVDPGLTGTPYLTGSQVLPQNTDLVHHAILFQVQPQNAADARDHDRDTPGQGWTCFGNAGLDGGAERDDDAAWIASWAPGTVETLLSPELGYPMPPGSLLVLQIHYNLLASTGGAPAADQSGIRLRYRDGGTAMTPLSTELIFAPVELPCAPGESGPLCVRAAAVQDVTKRFGAQAVTLIDQLGQLCNGGRTPRPGLVQQCDNAVPAPLRIHALGPHMHLLGKSLKVELNPGTAGARTLLDIPEYNFDDQAYQILPEPVTVRPGDVLRMTCAFDTGRRKLLPQLRNTPPRFVVWAEGTTDEMCLGILVTTPLG
ncbi:MAG: monooxygenase [Actinoplanes sp.]